MLNYEFKFRTSKKYILFLVILFSLSLLIFLCLPIAILIKIFGLPLLSTYAAYTIWSKGLLRGKHVITSLKYYPDGHQDIHDDQDKHQEKYQEKYLDKHQGNYQKEHWKIFMKDKMLVVNLQGDSVATAWVSVLRFKPVKLIKTNKRINLVNRIKFWFPLSCVIFEDSLTPQRYRELLMTLKMI